MRVVVRSFMLALLCATTLHAQRPAGEPPLPALSPEALAALDELSPRFAAEVELHQGWFRDRTVLYYDFGSVPAAAGRVLWPVHGFDAKGNPVAMRGQRPIFSTVPGLGDYSGMWQLGYVIVADNVQPNELRDVASAEAMVRDKRAVLRESNLTFNLALVAKGSRLARDSTPPMMGWYAGREVQFFDFGPSALTPVPLIAFIRGKDADGAPEFLPGQVNIIDTLPMAPPYAELWDVRFARADSTYVPNSLKSAAAVAGSTLVVEPANAIRNCPVAIVDGARVQRVLSPVTMFADLRSPFPPAPTKPR